jgi:hypothetical protein
MIERKDALFMQYEPVINWGETLYIWVILLHFLVFFQESGNFYLHFHVQEDKKVPVPVPKS